MNVAIRSVPVDDAEETGVDLELLERLRPFMGESLMVIDDQWRIKANLAPPGGLIGRGLGVGRHTLEDMHPDDILPVLELSTMAYESKEHFHGSVIVRMRKGDGTYGRYEITATNMLDDPVIAGVVVRTREIVEPEGVDVVEEIEPLLTTLAEILPVGVAVLARDGTPLFVNPAALSLLGVDEAGLREVGLLGALDDGGAEALGDALADLATSPGRATVQLRPARMPGIELECTLATHGMVRESSVVAVLVDVTEQRRLERELAHRAEHDPLTGLRNRAALLDELRGCLTGGEQVVVVYVDLDGFKAVNDRFGHAVGDRVLTVVARALQEAVGDRGTVARLGGDEFVAVLRPDTDGDALAGELRAAVEALPVAVDLGLSASVGVVHALPTDGPRELVHRADEAMYADKRRLGDRRAW